MTVLHQSLAALTALLLLVQPVAAQCLGTNMIAALPAPQQQALQAEVARHPYPEGNFWRAERDDKVLHLIGTYHLDDPRHAAVMAAIAPLIDAQTTLLVEAGPDEAAALRDRVARDPAAMMLAEGPTLPDLLSETEWQTLVVAMRARGVPPFMAARFQPWYVSMLLGIPSCAIEQARKRGGLDERLIAAAQAAGVPVRALEPYDTVLGLFDGVSLEDQLAMVRATLPLEAVGGDYMVTLADAYFAQSPRLIWEFTRLQAADISGSTEADLDADFARMEEAMITSRNRAWMPVMLAALDQGPVMVAFGALHLPGTGGVLVLLEQAGFTVTRLQLP